MYTVRDGRVFWGSHEAKKVDLSTFEIWNETWARDSAHVFSAGSRLKGVDPTEFVILNRIFARDSSRIFFLGGHAKKIAYPDSFEVMDDGVVEGDWLGACPLGYARDKAYVYFYEETFGAPRPLRGADASSFAILLHGWAADAKYVFCRGYRLPRADRKTFQVLGPHHGRDGQRVFYAEQLIPGAEPESFSVVEGLCGKDAKHVFLRTSVIEGADPESFNPIEDEFLARDRNAVYWNGRLLEGIDPENFHHLGGGYYRHHVAIYYGGQLLPDADSGTFVVLPRLDPAQKRAYWRGELVVPEAAVSGFTAMDAKNLYRSDFVKARKVPPN